MSVEIGISRSEARVGYLIAKRLLDLGLSLVSLPVVVPVVLLCSLAVVVTSPGLPLFRQWRVGKNGSEFRILKLRTMVANAERLGPPLTQVDDPRVTKVGTRLRRWSLDELPQVFNVIAGQMSLVGPRPELPEIVASYTSIQREVLEVKPGLTGWSQVNGRDDLRIPEKLELDRGYVRRRSLRTDVLILCRTFPVVLRGNGIKW